MRIKCAQLIKIQVKEKLEIFRHLRGTQKLRGEVLEFSYDLMMCESLMSKNARENNMVSGREREIIVCVREHAWVCVLKCMFA